MMFNFEKRASFSGYLLIVAIISCFIIILGIFILFKMNSSSSSVKSVEELQNENKDIESNFNSITALAIQENNATKCADLSGLLGQFCNNFYHASLNDESYCESLKDESQFTINNKGEIIYFTIKDDCWFLLSVHSKANYCDKIGLERAKAYCKEFIGEVK